MYQRPAHAQSSLDLIRAVVDTYIESKANDRPSEDLIEFTAAVGSALTVGLSRHPDRLPDSEYVQLSKYAIADRHRLRLP